MLAEKYIYAVILSVIVEYYDSVYNNFAVYLK